MTTDGGKRSAGSLVVALLLLLAASGCASVVKEKQKIQIPAAYEAAQTASIEDLITLVNQRYSGIESLVASKFQVEFHGGSAELGFMENYPKANGYLAARSPSSIYVNILNPLTNSAVVTMASRNEEFQIWAPRDNKYLTGRTTVQLDKERPLLNVRPHHLMNALLIEAVPGDSGDPLSAVFMQEDQDASFKYYILNVLSRESTFQRFCLARRIWFERSEMRLVRQQYYDCGVPTSTVDYGPSVEKGGFLVCTEVDVRRIQEHYRIRLMMAPEGLEVNRVIKEDRFEIPRPPGAELVVVQGD